MNSLNIPKIVLPRTNPKRSRKRKVKRKKSKLNQKHMDEFQQTIKSLTEKIERLTKKVNSLAKQRRPTKKQSQVKVEEPVKLEESKPKMIQTEFHVEPRKEETKNEELEQMIMNLVNPSDQQEEHHEKISPILLEPHHHTENPHHMEEPKHHMEEPHHEEADFRLLEEKQPNLNILMNPKETYGDDQIDGILKMILKAEGKKNNPHLEFKQTHNPMLNIVKRNPPINLSMPKKKCGMKY
jgi:hypothetical protein